MLEKHWLTQPVFHFLTVVWGEAYTRLYADLVMPTHASAGNAGAFAARRGQGDRYVIYTTQADAEVLRQSPAYAVLCDLMDVHFEWLDPWFDAGVPKHAMLSKAHKHGIERGAEQQAALVFLCPDAVWSDGTFVMLLRHVKQGKRGVMMPGIRVAIESFVPEFHERFKPDASGVVTARPRELVSLGLQHFHQISQTLRWDAPMMNPNCSHVYFPVPALGTIASDPPVSDVDGELLLPPASAMPDEQIVGYVMHCWHLHPLMIWPTKFDTRFASTIDGDFVMRSCPDLGGLHIVGDSDESVVLEMSPVSMNIEPRYPRESRVQDVANWRKVFADPYHRRYARFNLRLHDGRSGHWDVVEHQANRILAAVEQADAIRLPSLLKWFGRKVASDKHGPSRNDHGSTESSRRQAKNGILHRFWLRLASSTFRWRVWYWAHSNQWWVHARRRWWITKHECRVFMMRGQAVGWHKILGIRTRWWNLRNGRGPVLLPPRPVNLGLDADKATKQ